MISGWLLWLGLMIRHRISYKKVVIMLTGDNTVLDHSCIKYLPYYINRKYAKKAVVFYSELSYQKADFKSNAECDISFYPLRDKYIGAIYRLYSTYRFFDNIVFTYTDNPKDNNLGRYLRETTVNEEDAVCLALFHLRCVPDLIGTN